MLLYLGFGLGFLVLGFFGAPLSLWTILVGASLYLLNAPVFGLGVFGFLAILFNVKPIRRYLISAPLMKVMKALGLVPRISPTEKAALDAGAVWVEKEFFSGNPNFKSMLKEDYPTLTSEEAAYLNGPVEKLCERCDDWQIYQNKEIPNEVWDLMKKMKIFGMIIPKKYGGLEFSALAHSEVIQKLASRSVPVAVTAMVPNSLGPAELLNHYGTEKQKDFYLPRLASGQDIPCFALTEQRAGSDAGAIESEGILFKRDGKLWVRLNWNKRWITLAAVSTVLGLAFRLRDPDGVLGQEVELGITCALVPSNTKGVVLGRRHDPLAIPFYNCPTQGKEVEILVEDYVIGGEAGLGKGWTMLMECLGAGRGISLPSLSTGTGKLITRLTTAHSSIRKQFGVALCKLEGLEEPLSRITGYTYLMDAMRLYTQGALNRGIKPSVITAIAKYCSTELGRKVVNDGMDIMAGAGISRGPRNLIASIYQSSPISITVEGANILTRTLIIFGQGLLRAHPWAYKEVESIRNRDLKAFDTAIWGHVGHVNRSLFRAIVLTVTRGHLASRGSAGELGRYCQKLSWASSIFALLADLAMISLGGALKLKEMLTGRFADALAWQFICTAVIRRYQAEGSRKEDLPLVHFSLVHGLSEIQKAFDGIFTNLNPPVLGFFLRWIVRPLFAMNPLSFGLTDRQVKAAAKVCLNAGEQRDRITDGIYVPKDPTQSLGRIERAFTLIKQGEAVEKKIMAAIRSRELPKARLYRLVDLAYEKNIINEQERKLMQEVSEARWDACQVDHFSEEEYHGVTPEGNKVWSDEYRGPAGRPDFKKKVA